MTIRLEDVVSVYSGKANRCCCGCSGKHTYSSAHRDTVRRGYEVLDEEVNDRSVKMIFNKVFSGKYGPAIQNSPDDETIWYVDTDTRSYIVYLKGR